jgi:cobalt-zinc-cadmium efflux system protein
MPSDHHHHHDHDDHHDGHDHHGHDHHDHDHGVHGHAPASFGRAFAFGIGLNLIYVVTEAGYGIVAHSLALLADAGHNLGDVLGLATAWTAFQLGKRLPSRRFTYGFGRSSVMAALGNAVVLLIVTGGIAWEALRRLMAPEPSGGLTIIVVAAIGIAVNGTTALLFMAGRKGDLNIRGAFLHMASDALVSLGVVVAGALILATGWLWLDPAISLIVSTVIVAGTWSLLQASVNLSLDAVPAGIEHAAVDAYLAGITGVVEVHDLHIWGLSTTEAALTAHLICDDAAGKEALLPEICGTIRERFGIGHVTIQIETPAVATLCALRPDHVV